MGDGNEEKKQMRQNRCQQRVLTLRNKPKVTVTHTRHSVISLTDRKLSATKKKKKIHICVYVCVSVPPRQ